MRIILLCLLSFYSLGQVSTGSGVVLTTPDPIVGNVLTKLKVQVRSSAYSYQTSDATFGTYQTGANVISGTQISPDLKPDLTGNANTGLCYDLINDYIVVNDFINTKFYNRALSAQRTITPTGVQGMTHDPTTDYLYKLTGASSLQVTDAITGSVIDNHTISPAITTDGSLFYDFYTGDMYIANETPAVLVQKYRLSGTTWIRTDIKWWATNEGNTLDYVYNTQCGHSSSWLMFCDPVTGLERRQYNYPTNTMTLNSAFREGIFVDPRDGTVWFNYPAYFHGSVANGNWIWHVDPREVYKKYILFPDMIRYDAFKLSSTATKTGLYNRQQIQDNDWNVSPVIDFLGTLTGQQTLGNWTNGADAELENWDIEFRGSNTAPTTTATAATDYNDSQYYDANQTGDGWGATVPSAWQSTPGTWRYMQFRIRPQAPDSPTAPSYETATAIGSAVFYYEFDNKDYLWVAEPTGAIEQAVNLVDPGQSNISNTTTSQQPTFTAGSPNYASEDDLDNLFLINPSFIANDEQGEINAVFRRQTTGNLAVPWSASNNGSNNNYLWMGWINSGGATSNAPIMRYSDASGTLNTFYAPADAAVTFKMLSFGSDGATWYIYKDKVSQSLTMSAGSNTGAWFADLHLNTAAMGGYYISSFGNARSYIRALHYSRTPLTTQERSDLYDYWNSKGYFNP